MSLHNSAHWPEILFERMRERAGLLWKIEAGLKGAKLGQKIRFLGRPIITVARGSQLILHDQTMLCSGKRSNPLGCFQPCVLRTVAHGAELILESGVGLSAGVICAARSVRVGQNTIMGAGAMIIDSDFHTLGPEGKWVNDFAGTARPIVIGRSVFVGARALILKGVTIGDRAVIGAGSVVTRDVPSGCVAAGNPASIVRQQRIGDDRS